MGGRREGGGGGREGRKRFRGRGERNRMKRERERGQRGRREGKGKSGRVKKKIKGLCNSQLQTQGPRALLSNIHFVYSLSSWSGVHLCGIEHTYVANLLYSMNALSHCPSV